MFVLSFIFPLVFILKQAFLYTFKSVSVTAVEVTTTAPETAPAIIASLFDDSFSGYF